MDRTPNRRIITQLRTPLLFGLLMVWAVQALADDREKQVNIYTVGVQNEAHIEPMAGGGFIVVWVGRSPSVTSFYTEIRARLLDADGRPLGEEINVGENPGGNYQSYLDLVTLEDDTLVAVWKDDNLPLGIGHRRISASGVPLGQVLETGSADFSYAPLVTPRHGGGYLLVWECLSGCPSGRTRDTIGQVFDAESSSLTDPLTIAVGSGGDARDASTASLRMNGFIVVWDAPDHPVPGVRGRRLDVDGNALGTEILFDQAELGAFVIALGPDRFLLKSDDVLLPFNAAGLPDGPPMQLPAEPVPDVLIDPDVLVASNGDLWLAFTTRPVQNERDIALHRLDASGQLLMTMSRVNSLGPNNQASPALALKPDGSPVVVWPSEGSFGDDDDGLSVQVRSSFTTLMIDTFERGSLELWDRVEGGNP